MTDSILQFIGAVLAVVIGSVISLGIIFYKFVVSAKIENARLQGRVDVLERDQKSMQIRLDIRDTDLKTIQKELSGQNSVLATILERLDNLVHIHRT